jgi:Asp-tRNA(Asn)/Glu-tRNA(Gln) amidotransferase A subunit family amidase
VEYIRAQRIRTLLVEQFEKFMADWDVVVAPGSGLLTTTNLTGNPQVVVRCGYTETASPRTPWSMLGFIGRIYDEGSILRLALAYRAGHRVAQEDPHPDCVKPMKRRAFLGTAALRIWPNWRRRTPFPTPSRTCVP